MLRNRLFFVTCLIIWTILRSGNAAAQLVSPPEDELVPDPAIESDTFSRGGFSEISLEAMNRNMVGCISERKKKEVFQAFVTQVLTSNVNDCRHAQYLTGYQIRAYLLLLVNKSSIEKAESCLATSDYLRSVFLRIDNTIPNSNSSCNIDTVRCKVRARDDLNFRHFPHVGGFPNTLENRITRKGKIRDGDQVIVDQDYRGWSYVSAFNQTSKEKTAGWVSNRHLYDCQ